MKVWYFRRFSFFFIFFFSTILWSTDFVLRLTILNELFDLCALKSISLKNVLLSKYGRIVNLYWQTVYPGIFNKNYIQRLNLLPSSDMLTSVPKILKFVRGNSSLTYFKRKARKESIVLSFLINPLLVHSFTFFIQM